MRYAFFSEYYITTVRKIAFTNFHNHFDSKNMRKNNIK